MQATLFEKAAYLYNHGFYIGPRDPSRNANHRGEWMIAQNIDVANTTDASNGGFCIVGDDLDELIDEAYLMELHHICFFDPMEYAIRNM